MVLSSAWTILGIESTSDLREIKRAYSKLLKQNKPDENPEEFQRLHQAYKAALEQARSLDDQESTQHQTSNFNLNYKFSDTSTTTLESESFEIHNVTLKQHKPKNELYQPNLTYRYQEQPVSPSPLDYQCEINRILNLVEIIIRENRACDKFSWRILLESEYILDQEFIDHLGLTLLRRIAKYFNEEEYKEQRDFAIDADILFHLNSIFRWDQYEYDFSFYLTNKHGICQFKKLNNYDEISRSIEHDITSDLRGSKSIKKVFRHSDAPFKHYYYASNEKRAMAMIIDLSFLAFIMLQINMFSEIVIDFSLIQFKNYYNYTIPATYLLGAWLFESSRNQATPGKSILGLRVVNNNQRRLGYFHGFLRTVTFAISCIGSIITIFINSWSNGRFIHDRITKSFVMDLKRTRKDQL